MEALRIVRRDPEPEVASVLRAEESGVRRLPRVEDDLPDLTDAVSELRDEDEARGRARRATPPPIPDAALADVFGDVSLVDFDFLAKRCPPKAVAWQTAGGPFPPVPGIPSGFRVTPVPPAPRSFDYELALHVAVVWGSALLGGAVALF